MTGNDEGKRMTISEHLEELRTRVIRALLGIAVGFGICFWQVDHVMGFLRRPLDSVADTYGPEWVKLVQWKAYGSFVSSIKVAVFAGCVLFGPWVLAQIWGFIAAGLYGHERRAVRRYVLPGFLLFILGAWIAHSFVMPYALDFLVWWSKERFGVPSQLDIGNYVSLIAFVMFAFGLVFQLPVIMVFFMRIGLVQPRTFQRYWRHALLGCFVVAMVLTPPDVVSQLALGGCMFLLYEIAILIGGRVARERRKEDSR